MDNMDDRDLPLDDEDDIEGILQAEELYQQVLNMTEEEVAKLPPPPESLTEHILRMIGAHDSTEDNNCPYCGGTITIVDGREVGHHPAC